MFNFVRPSATSILMPNGSPVSTHNLHPNLSNIFELSHYVRPSETGSTLPFLLTCPHAGIKTTRLSDEMFADGIVIGDILRRGDMFTDWLTVNAPKVGATQIISVVAPSVLNVGRPLTSIHPDDVRGGTSDLETDANDKYVKDHIGQGLVSTRTLTEGNPIYHPDHIPDEAEIKRRIKAHYVPFHQEIETHVESHLEESKYCLIFDIHSCPSKGPPSDPDAGQERPDIVLSNNDGHASDPEIINAVARLAEEFDYSVKVNEPYKGGFITQKYARNPQGLYIDETWGRRGSESLQIEYNRKSFGLNEETLALEDLDKFAKAQEFTNRCLELLDARAQSMRQAPR